MFVILSAYDCTLYYVQLHKTVHCTNVLYRVVMKGDWTGASDSVKNMVLSRVEGATLVSGLTYYYIMMRTGMYITFKYVQ